MGRSPCCEKEHTNRGAWTKQEDELLIKYVKQHGEGCWRSLPKAAGLLRCGKSCRLRWINYLRPDLKRGNFSKEEDEIIVNLHSLLGSKWSVIASRLPGRTDNEIKNYWNTHIKRRLLSRGIDPRNQRALNQSSPTDNSYPIGNPEPNKISPSSSPKDPQTWSVAHDPMNSNNSMSSKADVTASAEEHSNSSSVLSEELQPQINLELSIGMPN